MTEIAPLEYSKLSYRPIFLDYVHRYEKLKEHFSGDPRERESWSKVARAIDAATHPRAEVSRVLFELNRRLGADDQALASVGALEKGALAVVTGQQVGILGGPLYTLYKALSAVRIARSASTLLDRPVVPLFWMDTDDHDFDEIAQTHVLNPAGELVVGSLRVRSSGEPYSRRSAEARARNRESRRGPLPRSPRVGVQGRAPGIDRGLRAGARHRRSFRKLPPPAHAGNRSRDRRSLRPRVEAARGRSVSSRDLGRSEVDGDRSGGQPESDGIRISRAGDTRRFAAQSLVREPGAAPHFRRGESSPTFSGQERLVPRAEVERLLEREPECFSPNVLLRPLYQDTLLPTLAYVAGPSELAYFAQLRGLYAHFKVAMPLSRPARA